MLDLPPLVQAFVLELCERIERRLSVRSIVLFGSLARGKMSPASDIDLIVVSDAFPMSYAARIGLLLPPFLRLRRSRRWGELRHAGYHLTFNPVAYRSKDLDLTPPLLLDVAEEGVVLRDDGLMATKLRQVRARLATLGARRVWTRHGRWYWVLKPTLQPGEIVEV